MEFEGWQAAAEANLNLYDWEKGGYTNKFKAKVIAWYRLRNLIDAHSSDAQSQSMKRKGK